MTDPSEEEKKIRQACDFKHTKYQPTDAEFNCPKCGAKVGDFCVDEGPNLPCPDLHDEDNLVCYGKDGKGCPGEYYVSGKAYVAALIKKKGLKPCEHCKGKGFVPTEK